MLKLHQQRDLGESSLGWILRARDEGPRPDLSDHILALKRRILEAREGLEGVQLVPGQRLPAAWMELTATQRALLQQRREQLQGFHLRTLPQPLSHQAEGGDRCRWLHEPCRRVGVLLPRHGMNVSMLLALVVPAMVAGVEEVVVAMEPGRNGELPPGVLAACELLAVRQVLAAGGADGVLALLHGVPSCAPVELLVGEDGPEAELTMRDSPLGHRCRRTDAVGDFCVLTDGRGLDAGRLAEELLWHAGLGGLGMRAILSSDSEGLDAVVAELRAAFKRLPRGQRSVARQSLEQRGRFMTIPSLARGVGLANALRPSRLNLLVHNPRKYLARLAGLGLLQLGETQLPSELLDRQPWALPVLAEGGAPVTAASYLRSRLTLRAGSEEAGSSRDAMSSEARLSGWASLEGQTVPVRTHGDST